MRPSSPEFVQVAVAILLRGRKVLVALRQEGSHLAGAWEFPGGKCRPNETGEECVRRELEEEIEVNCGQVLLLHRGQHAYAERRVTIDFFICRDFTGEPQGAEGQELRWVSVEELGLLRTPAANEDVLELLIATL